MSCSTSNSIWATNCWNFSHHYSSWTLLSVVSPAQPSASITPSSSTHRDLWHFFAFLAPTPPFLWKYSEHRQQLHIYLLFIHLKNSSLITVIAMLPGWTELLIPALTCHLITPQNDHLQWLTTNIPMMAAIIGRKGIAPTLFSYRERTTWAQKEG